MVKKQHAIEDDVLSEHRALEDLIVSIVAYVRDSSSTTPRFVERVSQDLRRLRGLLQGHFHREEKRGGLFEDLHSKLPTESDRVDTLRGEHGEFLEDVDGLVHRLETRRPGNLESLRQGLTAFLSTYEKHERTENWLLQKAYYRDIGAPD